MKTIGSLFLLYGIAAIALYFLKIDLKLFEWIGNWGENAAWGIRAGFVVLGFIVMKMAGSKKG